MFLPRPLLFVDALPRNSTGKLPRAALQALLQTRAARPLVNSATHFTVPPDHPSFDGHFPGTPILPGVTLLDTVLHSLTRATGITLDCCEISSLKFLSPAKPGDALVIQHQCSGSDTIRFDVMQGTRKIAVGTFIARGQP